MHLIISAKIVVNLLNSVSVSLKDIPDEFSLNKNSNKNISKSVKSNKNIRISNKTPVIRSLVNLDISSEVKGKNTSKSVQKIL